jgi:hypothetical protein
MGQTYAMAEVVYIVARMAQEFDAIHCRSEGPWIEKWNITLSSLGGIKVGLVSTKAQE